MALATLSIDLEARFAKLQEGFEKAEREAEKRSARIAASVGKITAAFAGLGASLVGALSIGAFTSWADRVSGSLLAIKDASEATGASLEKVSALEDFARRIGTPFETASSILVKFNGELSKATPGSGTERALAAIGLQAEELRRLDPADALQKTAQALSAYADNGDKARLVQELFGKSVKEAAPFLKELAEAGQLQAGATEAQILAADEYAKSVARLQANLEDLARSVFGRVIPAFNELFARFEKRGVLGSLADDIRLKLNEGLAQIASEKLGERTERLGQLLAIPQQERSPYVKQEIIDLRREITALQADALKATDALKRLANGGKPPEPVAPPSDKSLIFGRDGYGPAYIEPPRPEPSAPSRAVVQRLENPDRVRPRTKSISDRDAGLTDMRAYLKQEEQRLEAAARFGEQLRLQTADINASLIDDDRARGQAQIELDRQVLQAQLESLRVYGADRERLQEQLNANIAARQAALEESLKPAWQRMLETWNDTTRHMAESYEALMDGVVARTEDALTKMIVSGKLSLQDLADFVQQTIARIIAQKAVAKLFEVADVLFGGGLGGGLAKGGVVSGGEIQPYANGGIVNRPTYFPMTRGRVGLMGEAGPEAVMPLKRGPDGKLGVQASAQPVAPQVTINVASGVSRAELAAMLPMLTAQIKGELQMSMRRPGFA